MEQNHYIVGVGSSAGGLPPLREIVEGLSTEINAAIVVVPHLSPKSESNLDTILQRCTSMPVIKIEDGMIAEPGHIYVLPEGSFLELRAGELRLRDRESDEVINKAINIFFTSLASDAGNRAIGVILSGGGYDGLEGAKLIEDADGIVIVQDPDTAQFPLMPSSLIAYDHPDYILTPADIAKKITDRASG